MHTYIGGVASLPALGSTRGRTYMLFLQCYDFNLAVMGLCAMEVCHPGVLHRQA